MPDLSVRLARAVLCPGAVRRVRGACAVPVLRRAVPAGLRVWARGAAALCASLLVLAQGCALGAAAPGAAAAWAEAPVLAAAEDYPLNAEEKQTVSLFEENTPGVVFITNEVFKVDRAAELQAVPQGTGSGWVYDNDGHIVTNFHVIQNANALTVRFIEGIELPARIVGADPGTDVAVLQVDRSKKAKTTKPLKVLRLGDSSSMRVGQEVYAIGNPFGLDHTLTKGIVSGVGRTIMSVGGRPIQGAIQTDASINPGNSGGPLLNSRGQVIGMNTVIFSPSGASAGVGFAIPSDTVQARVQSILKYGYVKRAGIGVYLGQDGLAKSLVGKDGGIVVGLQDGSAAGAAGIRPGDVILSIDARRTKRINDIYAELDNHQPGETVQVGILRPAGEVTDGPDEAWSQVKPLTLKVELKEAATASSKLRSAKVSRKASRRNDSNFLYCGKWLRSHLSWVTKDPESTTEAERLAVQLLGAIDEWLGDARLSVPEIFQYVDVDGNQLIDRDEFKLAVVFMDFEDSPTSEQIGEVFSLLSPPGECMLDVSTLEMAIRAVSKRRETLNRAGNVFLKEAWKMTQVESNAYIFFRELSRYMGWKKSTPRDLFVDMDVRMKGSMDAVYLTKQAHAMIRLMDPGSPALGIVDPFSSVTRSPCSTSTATVWSLWTNSAP
ncbi:unnamed protein product [Prorocentrum cordatum]|uniref:EF-hand domain-containing protein n=1 Tax=Prorocentrum cordatum TaxID=2364126 RepID=A0ABN9QMN2_9DINO|nr:unnamed protein product [Polarella glacialis]